MEEFSDLENLWKHSETQVPTNKTDFLKIKNNRNKMKNTYIKGAIMLFITGTIILVTMTYLDAPLKTTAVISAMIALSAICFLQAILMLFTAGKISAIDETQTPATHLKQWQNFRVFQLKQRRWNMPVYFLLLAVSLGVYFLEILKNVDLWKMILAFVVTYSWMLFAYLYLGRKSLKKEDARINCIISELKSLENQFH